MSILNVMSILNKCSVHLSFQVRGYIASIETASCQSRICCYWRYMGGFVPGGNSEFSFCDNTHLLQQRRPVSNCLLCRLARRRREEKVRSFGKYTNCGHITHSLLHLLTSSTGLRHVICRRHVSHHIINTYLNIHMHNTHVQYASR